MTNPTVELFCWVLGDTCPFSVKISRESTISSLKDTILDKRPIRFSGIESTQLELCLANIDDDDNAIQNFDFIAGKELRVSDKICNHFQGDLPERKIHIAVKAPGKHSRFQSPGNSFPTKKHPSEKRRQRWEDLNSVLYRNKRAKTIDGSISTGYSCVSWREIEFVYNPLMKEVIMEPKSDIPQHLVESLYNYLSLASDAHGKIITGNESKRLFLINPILVYLVQLFKRDGIDNAEILVEESVPGKNIHVDGKFEFVITRGNKKICIVQAKKDDLEQGMAQDLLGCEAVADTESASCVCGVVTNLLEWVFLRSLDDKIEMDTATLAMGGIGGKQPTMDGLKLILGKFYALLCD